MTREGETPEKKIMSLVGPRFWPLLEPPLPKTPRRTSAASEQGEKAKWRRLTILGTPARIRFTWFT